MTTKQIIVLDVTDTGGFVKVNTAFWFPVTGTPIPKTNAVSSWKGISTQDLADLTSGLFIEEVNTFIYPHGTSKAAIEANLQALYTARNTALTAVTTPNAFYGIFFDSASGWSG